MKSFYITAVLVALAMSATPFWLLHARDMKPFEGMTVAYDSYGTKIKSLDPATCGDTTSAGLQGNFFESLYCYDYLKRPIEVIPQLADGMPTVSEDKLTYTIHIQKGIKYCRNACFGVDANGQIKTRTVRAEDFVLAFKRIADYHIDTEMSFAFIEDTVLGASEFHEKTKSYNKGDFSRYELPLEGVRALDEHTLQIKLKLPFPQLIYVLAINNYAPMPHEVIDYYLASRQGSNGSEPIPMKDRSPIIEDYHATVGTGAYFLREYEDGGDIVLQRNPDFRDERYPSQGEPSDKAAGLLDDAGKKVPFVDVRFQTYVPEANPSWMLFMTKQADTGGIPMKMYSQVITPGKELTDRLAKQGIRLEKISLPAVYWYAFNNEDKVLGASKSLRQALCLAFDVEQEIDVLYNGRGIRATNVVPHGFEAHDEAGTGPYCKFDLALAKKKIVDAKNELVAAGVIGKGDAIPALTLDLGGIEEDARRQGEFVQGQFKQIGVDVKIELNDWPTLQQKVHNKQCQIYSMGWHADYPDPQNFLQLYYTPNIKRGTNNCNYSNPEFDRLYDQVVVMQPSPERTAIYIKMIQMLSEDCPVLLMSEPVSFFLVQPWVRNVKPHPVGYGFAKFWRIDLEARQKAGGR